MYCCSLVLASIKCKQKGGKLLNHTTSNQWVQDERRTKIRQRQDNDKKKNKTKDKTKDKKDEILGQYKDMDKTRQPMTTFLDDGPDGRQLLLVVLQTYLGKTNTKTKFKARVQGKNKRKRER